MLLELWQEYMFFYVVLFPIIVAVCYLLRNLLYQNILDPGWHLERDPWQWVDLKGEFQKQQQQNKRGVYFNVLFLETSDLQWNEQQIDNDILRVENKEHKHSNQQHRYIWWPLCVNSEETKNIQCWLNASRLIFNATSRSAAFFWLAFLYSQSFIRLCSSMNGSISGFYCTSNWPSLAGKKLYCKVPRLDLHAGEQKQYFSHTSLKCMW